MKNEDLTIFEYRLQKEVKYTDIVKNERILGRAEKVSFFAENIGYIDGYIYRPQNSGTQKLPVIFNFHGGGMVLGYCEQDGGYCQLIADKTGSAVINVDYPLAPEYKYPLPVEGTYSFMTQLLAEADKYSLKSGSVQLMGHSAGGYLAAALCVMNSDKKQCEINAIALNYPLLSQQEDPSRRQAKDLSKAISLNRMKQYFNWYFDDPLLAREPMASPILAEPACFPPVLINAAGYDSLCGEEKEFAGKLSEAGKEARCLLYPECMHGFTHACFTEYSGKDAEKAWNAIAVFLKEKR